MASTEARRGAKAGRSPNARVGTAARATYRNSGSPSARARDSGIGRKRRNRRRSRTN